MSVERMLNINRQHRKKVKGCVSAKKRGDGKREMGIEMLNTNILVSGFTPAQIISDCHPIQHRTTTYAIYLSINSTTYAHSRSQQHLGMRSCSIVYTSWGGYNIYATTPRQYSTPLKPPIHKIYERKMFKGVEGDLQGRSLLITFSLNL